MLNNQFFKILKLVEFGITMYIMHSNNVHVLQNIFTSSNGWTFVLILFVLICYFILTLCA